MIGVLLVVAAQLLVPAWGLLRDAPRFGWQMYSGGPEVPDFTLVGSGGERERVRSSDFIANERSEVRYDQHLPPLLCERFPGTRYVLVTRESPALQERVPCAGG